MLRTLEIQNVSCGSCAVTIRTALTNAGFTEIKVDIVNKPHSVTAEIIDDEHLELMKYILRSHDYPLLSDPTPDRPDPSSFKFA